jgi:hypothetical protein
MATDLDTHGLLPTLKARFVESATTSKRGDGSHRLRSTKRSTAKMIGGRASRVRTISCLISPATAGRHIHLWPNYKQLFIQLF